MRQAAGSFGSRNGAEWTRQGADYRKRSEAAKGDTDAGSATPVQPLSPEAIRRAVEAQLCPWCGAGPYKVMAAHTNQQHGVSGPELRRLAGFNQSASICSPAVSQLRREMLAARPDREAMTALGNRRSVEVGGTQAAYEAANRQRRERNSPVHAEIMRLIEANPRAQFQDIGRAVGRHPQSVSRILRDAGVDVGPRRGRRPC